MPNTETYVRAYSGASVAVNIHHRVGENGSGPEATVNQRVFELAAIGAPQVVDRREDLAAHFEAGTHLLVFERAEQLRELVRAALQDFAASEALGVAARKEVLAAHTYMHRMRQILDKVVRALRLALPASP